MLRREGAMMTPRQIRKAKRTAWRKVELSIYREDGVFRLMDYVFFDDYLDGNNGGRWSEDQLISFLERLDTYS